MGKKKKNPTIQLRQSDIRRMKSEITDNAIKFGLIIFLTVMRDKEGYGVKRLKRVYNHIQNLVDSINRGYVSLKDLENTLIEEAGIVVTMGEEDNK